MTLVENESKYAVHPVGMVGGAHPIVVTVIVIVVVIVLGLIAASICGERLTLQPSCI